MKRYIFFGVIGGIAVLIVLLLFFVLQPMTYDMVLARSKSLIDSTSDINYSYSVNFLGRVNDEFVNYSDRAVYNKSRGEVRWVNNITGILGTIYDLTPELLVDLMMTNYSSLGLITAFDDAKDCYLLSDDIGSEPGLEDLVTGFYGADIMACFSTKTGYPLYYTLVVYGAQGNIFVNYKLDFVPYTTIPTEINLSSNETATI